MTLKVVAVLLAKVGEERVTSAAEREKTISELESNLNNCHEKYLLIHTRAGT